jgi:HAD superfamily hydrolase (TIGR01509 family)
VTLKALLWDVDGTMSETERDGHRVAFNLAFEDCGLQWRWDVDRYGELLNVVGGRQRLLQDMLGRPDAPFLVAERDQLAHEVHARKNAFYAELVQSGAIALRDGVRELMDDCRSRGVRMAITTTTSRSNVEALLRKHLGPSWPSWFAAQICGEDVVRKKPDPEVYNKALRQLGIEPLEAVALEDSTAGLMAARAANVPVVVTRSEYFSNVAFEEGALAVGPGLARRDGWQPAASRPASPGGIGLNDIMEWHDGATRKSRPRCAGCVQQRRCGE